MLRVWGVVLACALLGACSGFADKNSADDAGGERQGGMAAALEAALAEGEGGEADANDSGAAAAGGDAADGELETTALSTEKLREGLPIGMGSAIFMCQRTLSIVGEHCGCMVNRATDAGISDERQARLFGGRAGNATSDQIEQFTRIVRACSGYNVTIRGEPAVEERAESEAEAEPDAQPTRTAGRVVDCYFWNSVYEYDGRCRFEMGPGGDFATTSMDGPYFQDVTRIDLDVTVRGREGVLALIYPDGHVDRIAVSRNPSDKACWTGPKMNFCAR